MRERVTAQAVSARSVRTLAAIAALVLFAACGGPAPPPNPGQNRGIAPDLRGRRVLVLPVQQVLGVAGDPDAELSFGLRDRGKDIEWVFEAEVNEILTRSPGVDARTRGLPVGNFYQAEVERVGDPLYGQLRRMAGLVDADAIVLPVSATYEPNAEIIDSEPRVRFMVAIINPRTGRVAWFGVEEGGPFGPDDPRGLASAVEQLVRTMLWYVRT